VSAAMLLGGPVLAGVVLLGVLTRAMSPSMNHYILTQDKKLFGGQ